MRRARLKGHLSYLDVGMLARISLSHQNKVLLQSCEKAHKMAILDEGPRNTVFGFRQCVKREDLYFLHSAFTEEGLHRSS
jgi:hypothetical protein